MPAARSRDSARYWRTPLLPGADLVTATYRDHAFAPHWHDAYTIPVIEAGAERYTCRGTGYVAETGTVPVINPGEVHTGSRATDDGWRYRVSYVPACPSPTSRRRAVSSTKVISPGISSACSACRPGAGRHADADWRAGCALPARHRPCLRAPCIGNGNPERAGRAHVLEAATKNPAFGARTYKPHAPPGAILQVSWRSSS